MAIVCELLPEGQLRDDGCLTIIHVVVMAVMTFTLVLAVPVAIAFSFHFSLVVTIVAHLAAVPFSFPVSVAVTVSVPVALARHVVAMWPFRKEVRNGNGARYDRQKQNPGKLP